MIDIDVKHRMLQFTKDELQQILAQYNRTIDNFQVDVDCIKKWIESQPHLTQTPCERLILSTLMRNKFSVEKTKTNFDYYYSIRSMIPEVFQNRLPTNPDIMEMRKMCPTFTLPKLVNLNRVIFFVGDEMDHQLNPYTYIANNILNYEAVWYMDLSNSYEIIADFTNTNLAFWASWTPTTAKLYVTLLEKLSSNRLQAFRIIGVPSFGQILVRTVLAFLPEKLKKRVTNHSDRFEVLKYYPREQLPLEYGGSGPSFREMSKHFHDMVDSCTDYFQNIQNYKVNEELRPTKLDNDELLGYHGNFRNLEVD